MRPRIAALPALIISLSVATSSTGLAQNEPSPAPSEVAASALESLCAANAADDDALATCIEVVRTILGPDGDLAVVDEPGLADRLSTVIDEAVAKARGTDVQAAIDDAVTTVQTFDVEAALDEIVGSAEVDVKSVIEGVRTSVEDLDVPGLIDEAVSSAQDVNVEALIDDAITSAQDVDLRAFVDEVIAEIEDQEVLATIEQGIAETRNVVGAARTWIEENPELVCDTGSAGIGVGAAAVVGFLTDSPGLSLVAYRETQKAADGACGAVIG